MANPASSTARPSILTSRLAAGLVAIGLLGAIAAVDVMTGPETSLSLFYMLPLAIVTWYFGRRWGIAFCFIAPLVAFFVQAQESLDIAAAFWNAGMGFGVCLCFCLLLARVHAQDGGLHVVRSVNHTIIGTAAAACVLAGGGLILQQDLLARQRVKFVRSAEVSAMPMPSAHAEPITAVRASKLLGKLVNRMPTARSASRPVLLGSRDPNGPSCVTPVLNGQIKDQLPPNPADLDGGPGTKMGILYLFDRRPVTNSQQDYIWHQTRLRTNLENQLALNQSAQLLAHQLSVDSATLAVAMSEWGSWPVDFPSHEFTDYNDWPGYCLSRLTQAASAHDLASARRWSTELAAATFALEDLHRWLGFLVENHLASLDFQNLCASLFVEEGMKLPSYDLQVSIGFFPGGTAGLTGLTSYYEVERQAETLFAAVSSEMQSSSVEPSPSSESIWIPPALRKHYRDLGQQLTGSNRENWRLAPRTPFERSYLVNMLYRTAASGGIDNLRAILKQFNANVPNATLQQLMDVLMYRGHAFGGVEWGDRYQAPLLQAGASLPTSEVEAFGRATAITNEFYRQGQYGLTNTLREALDVHKLDCVRSTDMIAAIYRNSGRGRFGQVWWCAGTSCHSVAAYLGRDGDKPRTLLFDGLDPQPQPEVWPEAYFQGHRWPQGLQENAPPYCAELYVRGLDNYVWAEGYVIRGPNAGTLARHPVPYLPVRVEKSTRKVFNGPFSP